MLHKFNITIDDEIVDYDYELDVKVKQDILRRLYLFKVQTARRSNQCILKEISPGFSLEGMMLKLKLQCYGHLMRRVDSLEKILMLGGIWGSKRRG